MVQTFKKSSVVLFCLGVPMVQSVKADMIFYYTSAILPAIMASYHDAPPKILLNGDNPVIVLKDTQYTDAGASAVDAVDGNVPVQVSNYVNTSQLADQTVRYWATDKEGNTATATRTVKVVSSMDFIANEDHATAQDINASMTVDVLANDTLNTGGTVTVSIPYGFNGDWVASNNKVVFTPSKYFGGGDAHGRYQIRDTNGNVSETDIVITYPEVFVAKDDVKKERAIQHTVVDVLKNDVVSDPSAVEVDLNWYFNGGGESAETEDGTWHITGNQMEFTPNSSFGGGDADMEYSIKDNSGHESYAFVTIQYPKVLYAAYDEVSSDTIAPQTVSVLANDTVPDGTTPTVLLQYYGNNGQTLDTEANTVNGTWSVSGGDVTFTPNSDFVGGSVWMEYQISDQNGYKSIASIEIKYPEELYANGDYAYPTTLSTTSVDVLKNDIYPSGENVTVTVDGYSDSGSWSVNGNNVVFTPNSSFGGGEVSTGYTLKDSHNRTSYGWIVIDYPKELYAVYDFIAHDTLENVSVPVLKNDVYPSTNTIAVSVDNYSQYGIWSVNGENAVFEPNSDFGGGDVWTQYYIKDESNRTSSAGITIEFPKIFYAEYDQVSPTQVATTTIPVLDNDIVIDSTKTDVLLPDSNGNYTDFVEASDGNWSVNADKTVTFVPNDNISGGGSTWMTYRIVDTVEGYASTAGITVNFPKIFYAESDYVEPTDIAAQNIDVLANDITVSGAPVTVLLKFWGNDGEELNTTAVTPDGNWSIESDNTVTFVPRAGYGGGYVWIEYQISDTLGHQSTSNINIDFPKIFYAEYDYVHPTQVETTIIPVLDNDTVVDRTTTDVLLNDGNGNWGSFVEAYDGNWSVNADKTVTFTPNSTVNPGDWASINYRISDSTNGYVSENWINISY